MAVALASAVGVGHELFSYNRENFKFDREQQQKREYAGQNMRIAQFELYREDIRDLVELTVGKMDNYMIINALLLGFAIILMTEGRPKPTLSQPWLLWLFYLNTVGAFMYFTMSIWLALHASISAHSFGVRMLTQYVRLPVPNKKQIDAAYWKLSDYEAENFSTMLRIPVFQQMENMNAMMGDASSDDTSRLKGDADRQNAAAAAAAASAAEAAGDGPASDPYDKMLATPQQMLQHVTLYREVQGNWQAYDGYARVCMALGMNQCCHALAYYTENCYIAENNDLIAPAVACTVIFTLSAWLLCRLDLYVKQSTLVLAGFLLLLPPLLSIICISLHTSGSEEDIKKLVIKILIPIIFVSHVCWIFFLIWVSSADSKSAVRLPSCFRSVLYLDIFGWLGRESDNAGEFEAAAPGDQSQAANLRVPLLADDAPPRGSASSSAARPSAGLTSSRVERGLLRY